MNTGTHVARPRALTEKRAPPSLFSSVFWQNARDKNLPLSPRQRPLSLCPGPALLCGLASLHNWSSAHTASSPRPARHTRAGSPAGVLRGPTGVPGGAWLWHQLSSSLAHRKGSCVCGEPGTPRTAHVHLAAWLPPLQTLPHGWYRSAGNADAPLRARPRSSAARLPLPAPAALPRKGHHPRPRARIRAVSSVNVKGLLSPSLSGFPGSSGSPCPELGLCQELMTGRAARRGDAELPCGGCSCGPFATR